MLQDNFSDLENIRLEKMLRLRAEGIEPYPTTTRRNSSIAAAVQAYQAAEAAGSSEEIKVILAGRLRAIRNMGKLSFAHIEDKDAKVQLLFRVDEIGEELLQAFARDFDLGDFIEAEGSMFRTRRGEVTLLVKSFRMLAKALLALPADKDEEVDGKIVRHATLTDPETRFRQRYVDLAVNPEVREVFRVRAGAVSALRKYLDELGFLEVETPILQPLYGGAAARPFITHHNELDQDLYLRISFELYLKRLIVGGLDRVYEIGRDFRNEGVSYKHNPEFTQLEFYLAYADYRDIMAITEQMISYVAQEVLGTQILHFDGHEIDLTPPWKRLEIRQGLLEQSGIDISQYKTAAELSAVLREKGIPHNPNAPRGKMIGDMMEQFLEPILIQPTFLYDYPRDISPLAKNKPGDPQTTERFEGFIAGMELCNAFTELNDPLEQEKRFLELGRAYAEGDEERHPLDEDYLRALAYGMPPTGGFGMGIDRFIMLLTGHHNIREVILFPPMRDTSQA